MRAPLWAFVTLTLFWVVGSTIWTAIDQHADWTDKVTIVMLALTCGATFFAAKKYKPVTYGIIEVLAGTIGMGVIVFVAWDQPTVVLIYAGASSVYIVVRGLTNINDGLNLTNINDGLIGADAASELAEAEVIEDDGLEPWEFPPEPAEGEGDAGR